MINRNCSISIIYPVNFFYIPGQFWKHKNHILAFESIKILVDKGLNPCLVCTGSLSDVRDPEYVLKIKDFIKNNNLGNNIKLLGVVSYKDVFALMKFSEIVINPSLFEGWSSTVEECKTIKKSIVLSDIEVHKEQVPNGIFFDRYNSKSLSNILELGSESKINYTIDSLEKRTEIFACQYYSIVKRVI